jgi:ankyrin repeat protein
MRYRVFAVLMIVTGMIGIQRVAAVEGGPDTRPVAAARYDSYTAALIAAIHRFAGKPEAGDVDHLRALLRQHPELLNAHPISRANRPPEAEDAYTPLDAACAHGQLETAQVLLDAGAAVNGLPGEDRTPLHLAACSGNVRLAERLVQLGANVNARCPFDGRTPLHDAAQRGDLPMVKLLIRLSADVKAETNLIPSSSSRNEPNGDPNLPEVISPAIPPRTALDMARDSKNVDVVDYLESLGKLRSTS